MATALFISLDELKKSTALGGNVDADKLIPALIAVQELEVEHVLGTRLYDALSAYIIAGSVPEPYLTLKNKYIHNYMVHAAFAAYLPYASYQVTNGGVSKWDGGETKTSVELNELTYLINRTESKAELYKKRLIDYLCDNETLFPEYSITTTDNSEISPSRDTNNTNWFLN
jgi:hypothetical protein